MQFHMPMLSRCHFKIHDLLKRKAVLLSTVERNRLMPDVHWISIALKSFAGGPTLTQNNPELSVQCRKKDSGTNVSFTSQSSIKVISCCSFSKSCIMSHWVPFCENSAVFSQLEQAVVKEVAWFRDTALALEKMKTIHLVPGMIAEQLYEQKVRSHSPLCWNQVGVWERRFQENLVWGVCSLADFGRRDSPTQVQHWEDGEDCWDSHDVQWWRRGQRFKGIVFAHIFFPLTM